MVRGRVPLTNVQHDLVGFSHFGREDPPRFKGVEGKPYPGSMDCPI